MTGQPKGYTGVAKDKSGVNIDKRSKTAVYSTLHSKRDNRAVVLLHAFCAINGLRCVFYLDKRISKECQPSAWQLLLEDIAKGSFDVVITWLEVPGMKEFCQEHNTYFERVDPFAYSQGLRASRVDLRHL